MNNTTQYCILYAVLSQETTERLNMGIIAFSNGQVFYQYSQRKLAALRYLLPREACDFYEGILKNLDVKNMSTSDLEYLRRYSNNMFSVSEIQSVQLPYNDQTAHWLYSNYIDKVA